LRPNIRIKRLNIVELGSNRRRPNTNHITISESTGDEDRSRHEFATAGEVRRQRASAVVVRPLPAISRHSPHRARRSDISPPGRSRSLQLGPPIPVAEVAQVAAPGPGFLERQRHAYRMYECVCDSATAEGDRCRERSPLLMLWTIWRMLRRPAAGSTA
jgi:hypothetical protein